MKLQLPSDILSVQDLKAVILELQGYSKWAAHEGIKQRVSAKQTTSQPPTLSPAGTTLMQAASGGKALTPAVLDQLIAELQAYTANSPLVSITLAAPASNGLKRELVEWCRQNIGPNVLVSFKFNSTLLGGLVVRYGSHVFDWSFRRQILANKDKFPEVLRRV